LCLVGKVAVPKQIHYVFKTGMLSQVVNVISAISKHAALSVNRTDARSRNHYILQTNFDLCHSGPRKLLPALTRVVGIPIIHDVNKTKQQALDAEDGTRNRYLGWPDQLPRAAIG